MYASSAKPTDTASTSSDEDDDDDNAATYRSALIAVSVLFGVVTVIAGIVIYGKMSLSKANDINSPLNFVISKTVNSHAKYCISQSFCLT